MTPPQDLIATASDRTATLPPPAVAPETYPVGVAPVAATPDDLAGKKGRRLRRRPRMVVTAAVTGAMILLPLGGPTASARERDRAELRITTPELFRRAPAARGAAAAGPGPSRGDDTPASRSQPGSVAARPAAEVPTPVAAVSGIRLTVPSVRTALVGFHEAALPGSLEMASVAPLAANHNPRPMPEIAKPQPHQVAPVMVLPTRSRAQPPSTAVDIAVPAGEEILSLVDGTVTAVLPYTLYGSHPDVRIEIQPAGRPDLRVVVIHVTDVVVEAGDELTAGETPLAGSATTFPFESQIDRFVETGGGERLPHVHVEVRPTG